MRSEPEEVEARDRQALEALRDLAHKVEHQDDRLAEGERHKREVEVAQAQDDDADQQPRQHRNAAPTRSEGSTGTPYRSWTIAEP